VPTHYCNGDATLVVFWKYMKAKKQDTSDIPTLHGPNVEVITESMDKVNVLNKNF